MKKILFLGGATSQVVAVKTAKEMGYYTILCDYLPNNPGRLVADEWYPASTTDYAAVLDVAEKCRVDGVMTFSSDVASSTVAYVAEKLGLPGSPYESVYTLSHKDKFRQFLQQNGFHSPWSASFYEEERQQAMEYIREHDLPVMVKPTDSQGSKGVSKIEDITQADDAIEMALSYSRSNRIIVEEYIQRKGMQIGGDAFSVDGELVFYPSSSSYFSDETKYAPVCEFYPSLSSPDTLKRVWDEVQRVIHILGMRTQAYTIEAIEDIRGNIYIIEIGPRNGGTMIPTISDIMTGYSMIKASIQAAVGDPIQPFGSYSIDGYWAARFICSPLDGVLKNFSFEKNFEKTQLQVFEQYVEIGAPVSEMKHLSCPVACVVARFDTRQEQMEFIKCPEKYVKMEISNINI